MTLQKIRNALRLFFASGYRFSKLSKWGLYDYLPDEEYLKKKFYALMKTRLDFENPETFNEKLQWLKMYDRRPEYTAMVDKLAVKRYIAEKIGEQYVIPTLGVWERFEDIDFDRLPDQFVLKCTHDSGGLVICKDKSRFNRQSAKRKINRSLKHDFFLRGREWPYKDVPRKIIAEKYMEDSDAKELRDYKVHNFNGEAKLILVCGNRFSKTGLTEDFFTEEWEHIDVRRPRHPNAEILESKPEELQQILELSRVLSKGIPFVRTDFYIINHKVYFGEITFYPASGFVGFEPNEFDYTFGSYLSLPEKDDR